MLQVLRSRRISYSYRAAANAAKPCPVAKVQARVSPSLLACALIHPHICVPLEYPGCANVHGRQYESNGPHERPCGWDATAARKNLPYLPGRIAETNKSTACAYASDLQTPLSSHCEPFPRDDSRISDGSSKNRSRRTASSMAIPRRPSRRVSVSHMAATRVFGHDLCKRWLCVGRCRTAFHIRSARIQIGDHNASVWIQGDRGGTCLSQPQTLQVASK